MNQSIKIYSQSSNTNIKTIRTTITTITHPPHSSTIVRSSHLPAKAWILMGRDSSPLIRPLSHLTHSTSRIQWMLNQSIRGIKWKRTTLLSITMRIKFVVLRTLLRRDDYNEVIILLLLINNL